MALFLLFSLVASTPFIDPANLYDLSTLMHYSTANYCQSTRDHFKWDCKVYVSAGLGAIEPRSHLLAVSRCSDDGAYGNDYVGSFKQTGNGYDGNTDTSFFSGYNDNQRKNIISFKGTSSIPSAFVDVAFALNDGTRVSNAFANTKLHTGFMFAYNTVRQKVISQMQDLCNRNNYEVIVTGHSLGGALASIAALDFVTGAGSYCSDRVKVVTFGAPRVGDLNWASFSQRVLPRQYRVVHEKDVVPAVPPRFWGYYHAGQAIKITGSYKDGFGSYRSTFCDTNAVQNTGESANCLPILQEDLLMKLFKDVADGGGFDWGNLLKAGENLGNALLNGILSHITNYFSFFTYPAVFPLTTSFTC